MYFTLLLLCMVVTEWLDHTHTTLVFRIRNTTQLTFCRFSRTLVCNVRILLLLTYPSLLDRLPCYVHDYSVRIFCFLYSFSFFLYSLIYFFVYHFPFDVLCYIAIVSPSRERRTQDVVVSETQFV